jgi:hypothetical protein
MRCAVRWEGEVAALDDEGFEAAYDLIAAAIDRVGPGREREFLASLCLLLAHRAGTLAEVERAVQEALAAVTGAPRA